MVCLSRNELNLKRKIVRELLDLQDKIDESISIIEFALSKSNNPVIAFSGGKDSLVVLDLVRRVKQNVVAVFENTTNEYPETLKYIKTIENIIELKPEMSFNECWDKYGMPMIKDSRKINYNPIYDRLGRSARCGCRLCTAYISWKDRTSQYNEKDTHFLIRKQGYKPLIDFINPGYM